MIVSSKMSVRTPGSISLEQIEWEHRITELASHLLQDEDDFDSGASMVEQR